jgi:hypothetical protein
MIPTLVKLNLVTLLVAQPAHSIHLTSFTLEGESLVAILTLQQPSLLLDWPISTPIQDILSSILSLFVWKVRKVNRNVNFMTTM